MGRKSWLIALAMACLFALTWSGTSLAVGPYTINIDGTVRDNATGLIWQRNDEGTQRTWEQALAYCEALSLGARNDWRLPNQMELSSLVDFSRSRPAIDSTAFPLGSQPRNFLYWSSTSWIPNIGQARLVDFEYGNDYVFGQKSGGGNSVRCVRGGLIGFTLSVLRSGDGNGIVSSSPAGIACGEDCTEDYAGNTQVNLTVAPDSNSVFMGWSGGGCSGTGSCTVAMTTAITVTATFSLAATVPSAPIIGTAWVVGDGQATVDFNSSVSNGGSPITGYTVTSNPGGVAATGLDSPISVSGLTNGIDYTFTVVATNAVGTSAASAASNSVTPMTVPSVPIISTVTPGDGQATVTFTAPASNGGSPITEYKVTSSRDGLMATGTDSPITVTGLTNGVDYTFIVVATNAAGDSGPSVVSNSVTPQAVPGAPDAPVIGTATTADGQATINFTAPASNGGSPIVEYRGIANPGGKTAIGFDSPITVFGLTNGIGYTFTVVAINAVGASPASGASNSVTPMTVPSAPVIGTVTAGDGQATVTFTVPASNGGSPITEYKVSSDLGGVITTGTDSPITITGLTNGADYTFMVVATNAAGDSAPSAISGSVTPKTVPDAPTVGTVTAGDGQATVTFIAPLSNGGSPITEYAVTSNPSGVTAIGTDSPITVTGLSNGVDYTFIVLATNAAGNSAPSGVSESVTPQTVPDAPIIGTATADDGQATVTFTAPASDGGNPITEYTVTSSPSGTTASGTDSPITVTGLVNGIAYTFIVVATNAAGDSAPSAASGSVTPQTVPDAPIIGTATAGDGQATVTFTGPVSNGGNSIAEYKVTSNPGGITATGTASPITVAGLTNGIDYTFTVVATNAAGDGAPSAATESVTPQSVPGAPDAPIIGTATVGDGRATVTFTPPASDGGSPIIDYIVTSTYGGKTAIGTYSPIDVTGLVSGTVYTFTVVARNAVGASAASMASNSVTPLSFPGAPIIGTATAGDGQVMVYFNAPASNGGSLITEYKVTSSPGGIAATGTASPITVTGLTNGTEYIFTVTATNAVGIGPASLASNIVTPNYTISGNVGQGGTILKYTDGTVKSTTTDAGGNYSFTVSYDWSGTVTPSKFGYTFIPAAKSYNNITDSQIDQNFTAEAYYIYVSGNSGIGRASISYFDGRTKTVISKSAGGYGFTLFRNWSGTVTPSKEGYDFIPATKTYSNLTTPQTNQNFIAQPKTYTVTAQGGNGTFGNGAISCVSPVTYNDSSVCTITPMAGYHLSSFSINGVDKLRDVQSNSYTIASIQGNQSVIGSFVINTAPGAPGVGIAKAGNGQATILFTPPDFDGGSPILSYDVISSPGAVVASGSGSPIVVLGLTNGTFYSFTVAATNIVGTGQSSAPSNSVRPATVPGAPNIGTANVVAGKTIVTFSPPLSNGESEIVKYTVTSNQGGITASGSSSPISVSGLVAGTDYSFTVTATNDVGTGPPSAATNSIALRMNSGSVVDAPHNQTHGISCSDCHSYSMWWKNSPLQLSDPNCGAQKNAVCFKCHGTGGAAISVVHSKMAMGVNHNPAIGDWSSSCVDCHDPHLQDQLCWRETDATDLFLATGQIAGVVSGQGSETTFSYDNLVVNSSAWDPSVMDWGWKNPLGPQGGLILVVDTINASNTFEVISVNANTMAVTVKGILDGLVVGKNFGVMYGSLIRANIQTPSSGMKSVKFFDPNLIYDSYVVGGLVDSLNPNAPQGLCQVCHTQTINWKSDGSGNLHNTGVACVVCHKVEKGFSPSP